MDAYINELLTGVYDHDGECILYGDSVTGDALIKLADGRELPIATLFEMFAYKVQSDGDKEYAIPREEIGLDGKPIRVLGYNAYEDTAPYGEMAYVMRHRTRKKKWRITAENGQQVTVTEDHSLIVDRDGFTLEVKPSDLLETDLLISFNGQNLRDI